MTDKSNLDNPDKSVTEKKELKEAPLEAQIDRAQTHKNDIGNRRKSGLSKREIMEELNRARFPWEE